MKRSMPLCLIAALLCIQACTFLPGAEPTPTPLPASTTAAPVPTDSPPTLPRVTAERFCGDGICDGPENAETCPQDCATTAVRTEEATRPTPHPTRQPTVDASQPVPPVYVTIAGHIEDTPVYARCEAYTGYRENLLLWAEAVHGAGAAVNLQIDYEFFAGASRCETPELRNATTGGENVIHYLATRLGFEIDAHQEGGWEEGADNYADVRFLGETVTPAISDNVGGLVWDDPEQFARLAQGETGWMTPDYTWYPQVLTLAVSRDHHLGDFSADDVASGVWQPAGAGRRFWVHDPDAPLVYVGPGEHSNWDAARPQQSTPEFVHTLVRGLREGTLDRDRMYTASIAVPQSIIFDPERHSELLAIFDQLAPLIESDAAKYVTYSQAVDVWRSEYDAGPNVFFRDGVEHPADVHRASTSAE